MRFVPVRKEGAGSAFGALPALLEYGGRGCAFTNINGFAGHRITISATLPYVSIIQDLPRQLKGSAALDKLAGRLIGPLC